MCYLIAVRPIYLGNNKRKKFIHESGNVNYTISQTSSYSTHVKKTFLTISSIEFYVLYHLKIASEMVQCGTNILYPRRDLVLPTYLPSFLSFFFTFLQAL